MGKRRDDGQQHLKVITTIDESQDREHIDPSGQVLLFNTQKVLVPKGFEGFADFMNNRLHRTEAKLEASAEQSKRLANSLEKIIPKFLDQSVNNANPDIVFKHLNQGEQSDVAIADGAQVLGESLYILTTGEIADRIGNKSMTANRMSLLLRALQLYGDPKFHHSFKTGRKGLCQKYKLSTIDEIYARLQNPEHYGIGLGIAEKYADYIKPRGVQS